MNRLTILIDDGLDKIYFEVPSDKEGLYNIVDVVELLDDDERDEILFRIAERVKAYEDTGLEPEDILSNIKTLSSELNNAFEELKEYKRLEEQGLLIKLPCKEQDTIYVLEPNGNIQECKVYNITTNIYANSNKNNPYWKGFEVKDNLFGKTVFLTREEAEKALEAGG